MLRQAIAEARGFGADVQRPTLAKIMLAERFYPDFYEQIARLAAASPDGKVNALGRFEDHVRGPPADEDDEEAKPAGRGAKKPSAPRAPALPAEAEDWLKNEWAKGWAGIDPPLKDVDLRPYVFVTRDKRSALGGLVAAGHLEGLVERLMGPRMMARSAAPEVAKLSGPEPEEVFDAIRGRILQEDSFTKVPDGVQGLAVLVENHPALQRRLLEFLRELPVGKLGAWAASSWGTVFSDGTAKGDYAQIVTGWSEQSENQVLQAASKAIAKIKGS